MGAGSVRLAVVVHSAALEVVDLAVAGAGLAAAVAVEMAQMVGTIPRGSA